MLLGREEVDDAIDGGGRRGGVQRAEDEVAGVGGLQGQGDGLEVAQLAHEDDVGVLAQGGLERAAEARGVTAHLALVHQRLVGHVHELDWVLQREDVAAPRVVDRVDHRGERGGLAGPGGARHEHEALGLLDEAPHHLGQPQLGERKDFRRNLAHDGAHAVAVAEEVHAEARQLADGVSEVHVVVAGEGLGGPGGHHGREHHEDLVLAEHVLAGHWEDLAIHPPTRRLLGAEVQVGGALGDHPVQQRVEAVGAGGGPHLRFGPGRRRRGGRTSAQHLVEGAHREAAGRDLHAGNELADGADHHGGGVVHEADLEAVAALAQGHHAVALDELAGEEVLDSGLGCFGGGRQGNRAGRIRQAAREPPGEGETEARHLVAEHGEGGPVHDEEADVGNGHDAGGALVAEQEPHLPEAHRGLEHAELGHLAGGGRGHLHAHLPFEDHVHRIGLIALATHHLAGRGAHDAPAGDHLTHHVGPEAGKEHRAGQDARELGFDRGGAIFGRHREALELRRGLYQTRGARPTRRARPRTPPPR